MTNAAIYCRISRDTRGDFLGVTRQEADCRALAERLGWTVAVVHVDDDTSAYSGRPRPGYLAILQALKDNTVGAVIAWHPDRLHRSPRELEDFIDLIENSGARVATVQAGEYDLGSPAGRMTARVVGAVARHESEHKSVRIRRKHLELADAGAVSGGGDRPFGYEHDRVTVRHAEAELLREATARIVAGDTVRSICIDWIARGIRTTGGRDPYPSGLQKVLLSGRIAGLRVHKGRIAGPAVWPAIVDETTWRRVQAILTDPARRPMLAARRYLLTGLLSCGICGAKLVSRPRQDKRRCYVCAKPPGFVGCGGIRIISDILEAYVVDLMLARLDTAAVADRLTPPPADIDGTVGELGEIEARLGGLADQWADGKVDDISWARARKRLDARMAELRDRLAAPARTVDLTGVVDAWATLPFDRQRSVLFAVLEGVTVSPAVRGLNRFDARRVTVRWRA